MSIEPRLHVQAPQHTDLGDLREHVITYLLANLPTAPHEQNTDAGLIRENAPFDFSTEAQGDPRAHLSLGAVFGNIQAIGVNRARSAGQLMVSPTLMVGIGYRLRPLCQDEDYRLALTLLGLLPKFTLAAILSYVGTVNPLPDQLQLAVTPVPGRSPYVRLLLTLPLASPLEV